MKQNLYSSGSLEESDRKKFFKTSDLGLAAVLIYRGVPPHCIDLDNPKRPVFLFWRTPAVADVIEFYYQDDSEVVARRYFEIVEDMRTHYYE